MSELVKWIDKNLRGNKIGHFNVKRGVFRAEKGCFVQPEVGNHGCASHIAHRKLHSVLFCMTFLHTSLDFPALQKKMSSFSTPSPWHLATKIKHIYRWGPHFSSLPFDLSDRWPERWKKSRFKYGGQTSKFLQPGRFFIDFFVAWYSFQAPRHTSRSRLNVAQDLFSS